MTERDIPEPFAFDEMNVTPGKAHSIEMRSLKMKWRNDAQESLSRVPFFVRGRVRRRVEEEAARCGASEVTMVHVEACRRRFLNKMEDEVKGYQVESCFGSSGCPRRAVPDDDLPRELEALLADKDLRTFLKQKVQGPLKLHHEFRVTVADCPNACSRPQIVDVGLIGAVRPEVTGLACSQCGACIEACDEEAITLPDGADRPLIDLAKCVCCGDCVKDCPSGTLRKQAEGYRLLVGGKLGRHPQLGRDMGVIFRKADAVKCVVRCVDHYLKHCGTGERFGEVLNRTGHQFLESPEEINSQP